MEILAEDVEDDPNALWDRDMIEDLRVRQHPELARVVVGVDPPGGQTECGIVVAGLGVDGDGYIIDDRSLYGSPGKWGGEAVTGYHLHEADRVLGERNYGGDMVESTIKSVADDEFVAYSDVYATRGKAVRAEPVAALYEKGRIHHVGELPGLEDEMCTWVPGQSKWSPNRVDALVWTIFDLMIKPKKKKKARARARG
jgi:phage terminase large subunit-like protein